MENSNLFSRNESTCAVKAIVMVSRKSFHPAAAVERQTIELKVFKSIYCCVDDDHDAGT